MVPEPEYPADHADEVMTIRLDGLPSELRDWTMRDLVHNTAGKRFDGFFLLGRELAEPGADPLDFSDAQLIELFLEADDGRGDLPRFKPRHHTLHLFGDDLFGLFSDLCAVLDVAVHHLLEVIDVIQEHVVQFVHGRVDVARHSDIDEEHRAVPASLNHPAHLVLSQDVLGRSARCDHDIHLRQRRDEALIRNYAAAEHLRHFGGALLGSVRDCDQRHSGAVQVTGGELRHLPSANEQDLFVGKRPENLASQLNRCITDGDGALADIGFRPYAFGDVKGARDQQVEETVNRALLLRGRVGGFELAKNLGFAHHHGIQTGCHPEQVADGVLAGVVVQVRGDPIAAYLTGGGEKIFH